LLITQSTPAKEMVQTKRSVVPWTKHRLSLIICLAISLVLVVLQIRNSVRLSGGMPRRTTVAFKERQDNDDIDNGNGNGGSNGNYRQEKTIQEEQGQVAAAMPKRKCAANKGIIVTNMLGRLGNSLLQVTMANRLAEELCWDVVYRKMWGAKWPNPRGRECFPNAILPQLTNISSVQDYAPELEIDAKLWDYLRMMDDETGISLNANAEANIGVEKWAETMDEKGLAFRCVHESCDFTKDNMDKVVGQLSLPTSKVRVVYLKAFFVHYDWMRDWGKEYRHWLAMDPSCCPQQPPADAVVIHMRDFSLEGITKTDTDMTSGVYMDILEHYNLTNRPVWIVCQPESVDSILVKNLTALIPTLSVHPGVDEYDAFCILTRAKTFIASMSSTFSQMAGLLADPDAVLHYPTFTLNKPRATMKMPMFKYHLVHDSMDKIETFDVDHDNLIVKMA
jgi:hypothetical protein